VAIRDLPAQELDVTMSKDDMKGFNFEVSHFGVNAATEGEALAEAGKFSELFGLQIADGKDSVYAGPRIELMKGQGRGTCGHIGIATDDIHEAMAYLVSLGCRFDPASSKYDEKGTLIVIYLKDEIAGFAVHLLQR
jgi:2-dehydro-3-deoxyphosphogluconate aldolase/(4S)-4-hydroxy-2-oxoglutarate aldolase